MANIPTYTSRVTPTTEPPRVYIKPAKYAEEQSPELAAKTSWGASMEQAGKIVNVVAEKMLKIQNANSESEANILTTQGMAEYEDEVSKRTDLNTALKDVDNRIQKIKKAGADKFTDPRARAEWERNFDIKSIVYQNALKNKVLKRQVDLGRTNTLREMDLEASNYINAFTPEAKLISRQRIDGIMSKAISNQLFTEEQGYDEVNKVIKSADDSVKDLESLKKRKEKEIDLAAKQAKNAREEELVEMRVNNKSSLNDLIIQARTDMNAGRIDAKFAEAYINSCITPKLEKPTSLESVMKYNELAERNVDLAKKENSWFRFGKVPFEDLTKYRADVFDANAKGYITDKQLNDLLNETSKTFLRDPVFQNTLNQLAAQSSLYATPDAQARAKAEMYSNLITKVIGGEDPRIAVTKVIQEKLATEVAEAMKVDEFGFVLGDKKNGYEYIGNNQWKKKK